MAAMTDFALVIFHWVTAMIRQFPVISFIIAVELISIIGMILYVGAHLITGIPIAISKVQMHHFSNYVGFPVGRREWDAQSISYGDITVTNISPTEKVALEFILHITGPDGMNLKTRADLTGPFGMILGKDDNTAKQSVNRLFGETPKYFRNPVELDHGQIEKKRLEFVFDFGSDLRDKFAMIMTHDQDYKFELEISDLISGRTIVVHIPGEYRGDH
jgi:hypothetical protein